VKPEQGTESARTPRIAVIGTRGFPGVQGGVERHCEELYPRLAALGYSIDAFRRRPFLQEDTPRGTWRGVTLTDLWAPRMKGVEALIHSALAALRCLVHRRDLVHVHNIGPALVVPLLRLAGLRTVVTYHSPNYEHAKWGGAARLLLRLGEKAALGLSHRVIFVSGSQRARFAENPRYVYIPNGVSVHEPRPVSEVLGPHGLEPGRYFLAVGRLTPEKGFDMLLEAFAAAETDWRLAIAGAADHETDFSRELLRRAEGDPRAVMTGYLDAPSLATLYGNAGAFVLPSRNEGMPLALLEALSYGAPALVSDIPATREVLGDQPFARYFGLEDAAALRVLLETAPRDDELAKAAELAPAFVRERFCWDAVAARTAEVYADALHRSAGI
jgi:glycosyltransferase involved in cell wall biosynthesis